MNSFIVKKYSVSLLAMAAQALAVVGCHHDESVVVQFLGLQRSYEFSDCGIR